jgi:SAM-dependent methyltransferase
MDHDDHVALIRGGIVAGGVAGVGAIAGAVTGSGTVAGAAADGAAEGVAGSAADRAAQGVAGSRPSWLELGAGEGAFTLALADVLGPGGSILANDLDAQALWRLDARMREHFPATRLETRAFDFTDAIPYGPFDGVLAANSLHFVRHRDVVLRTIRFSLRPEGRLVVVEYDADRGNPWVPYPFSFETWRLEATAAGFDDPRLLHRVPSRFLGAIYGSIATRRPDRGGPGLVLHSRPHGEDREE